MSSCCFELHITRRRFWRILAPRESNPFNIEAAGVMFSATQEMFFTARLVAHPYHIRSEGSGLLSWTRNRRHRHHLCPAVSVDSTDVVPDAKHRSAVSDRRGQRCGWIRTPHGLCMLGICNIWLLDLQILHSNRSFQTHLARRTLHLPHKKHCWRPIRKATCRAITFEVLDG